MYLLWLASFAFGGFSVIIAPDIARYFSLDEMAFQLSRWVRRKWRQTWLKVWRTNGDWGSHG